MNNSAFCITGWHYNPDFYRSLSSLSGVDIYIISHKRRRDIPDDIFGLVEEDRVLIRPNLGYDWGCFQQFLKSELWRGYETIFFIHDDIDIHDFGFIEKTKELLQKHKVVGNGFGEGAVSHANVNKHPYAYTHSNWKPKEFDYQHSTVRGSFFATTDDVLAAIGGFEVFWDPLKINIGFGNWSTKASCGKLEEMYGDNCFGFLSDTFGSSKYITEYIRGDKTNSIKVEKGFRNYLYTLLKRISTFYLEIYYRLRKVRLRSLLMLLIKLFLWPFSGRLSIDRIIES